MAEKGGNNMLFPAPSSQQRLSSSAVPRKKVILKPGRSLMDWIRLGRSGEDLTGVGGKVLKVSVEDLAKHNKLDDAWTAIRGKVYNITPYMEYHPGGQEELMRGAGIDGTQLFDEIHKWVNAESMLEKCFVGHLAQDSPVKAKRKGSAASAASSKSVLSCNGSIGFKTPSPQSTLPPPPPQSTLPQPPSYDWFQNNKSVTVVVYTRWKHVQSDYVDISKINNVILITVLVEQYTYTVHVDLQAEITPEYVVRVHSDSGKVEITLPKAEPEKQWSSLGKPLSKDKSFVKTADAETVFQDCTVVSVSEVTHDTKLLCIAPPEGCRHCVPVGHHVHVRHSIEGMEIARAYTAVQRSLNAEQQDPLVGKGRAIYLMIKIYPDGVLTPWINTLQSGDTVSVSESDGTFELSALANVSHLVLFAAGTGFTPMVRLIYHTVVAAPADSKMKVHLLFYNKRQQDIMWREQLETLAAQHERFQVTHILSEADETWTGLSGRLCMEHVRDNVPAENDGTRLLVCVCGPKPYTLHASDLLQKHGLAEGSMHLFLG